MRITVAGAVVNQTPLDWARNRQNLQDALRAARDVGASVVCLPELAVTGYGCEDAFYAGWVPETALGVVESLLPETRGLVTSFGVPLSWSGALYNTQLVVVDGVIVAAVAKQHLAGDGLHYEPRWFKAWPYGHRAVANVLGREIPLGDLHLDVGGVRLGFEICEDAWVADRPGARLGRRGVQLVLNPSASHFAFDKIDVRRRLVLEGSRAFGCTYVYSNLLGNEAGRAIYDGGTLIASCGELVAEGRRFSFQPWLLTHATVDLDIARTRRARTASFRPLHLPDDEGLGGLDSGLDRVTVPFAWPHAEVRVGATVAPPRTDGLPQGEGGPLPLEGLPKSERRLESFTRAIGLALLDYLVKSRSRGFVVSLSGGADSAAVSVLVAAALRLARHELGDDALARRLGLPTLPLDLVARTLTTVYQATRNSSTRTLDAARGVAEALGAHFAVIDVDALVGAYTEKAEAVVGRSLSWETDDIALQNIQARVRAPGIWMVANVLGKLLLATSNRSEAAVGYATMDGDTCGGLSPIAGIDKAFLRRWLRFMEVQGPAELGPLPALALVNTQEPTAELRPAGEGQTDEKDLMPYPVLDAIERAAIGDLLHPVAVLELLGPRFPEVPRATLAVYVERFFRLFAQNQWKRERYAPSFHVDDENLDPKTWCRFPILSGAFHAELAALSRAVGA